MFLVIASFCWRLFLISLRGSVKLVVGVPCAPVWKGVPPINNTFTSTKMKKKKATQRTNQGIPLWANPLVVSFGPSLYLMMDCSATLQDWENPSFLSAQTTYTSVIILLKGKKELFYMKIRHPGKNSGRSSPKQQLGAKTHLQGKMWIWRFKGAKVILFFD